MERMQFVKILLEATVVNVCKIILEIRLKVAKISMNVQFWINLVDYMQYAKMHHLDIIACVHKDTKPVHHQKLLVNR